MAKIVCPVPSCQNAFPYNDPTSLVTRAAAAGAGAWGGAVMCGSMGILAAPGVGISGAIPGAVVGGLIGMTAANQFRRCPKCGKIFKT